MNFYSQLQHTIDLKKLNMTVSLTWQQTQTFAKDRTGRDEMRPLRYLDGRDFFAAGGVPAAAAARRENFPSGLYDAPLLKVI